MGWLIALAMLVLLALLPLGGSVIYDQSGLTVKVLAGPIRFQVYPGKKKEKPPKEPKTSKEKKNAKSGTFGSSDRQARAEEEAAPGGSLRDFLPLVELGIRFLGDFRRKLRVDMLRLKLTMAGDDPCDLAVGYGRTCAAVEAIVPMLERWFVIRKRKIDIGCDFLVDETVLWLRLDITITLGRIVSLLVRHGTPAFIEYYKITKSRKGGAVE